MATSKIISLSRIESILSVDLGLSDEVLVKKYNPLSDNNKKKILSECRKTLFDHRLGLKCNTEKRIRLLEFLLALAPDSWDLIEELLLNRSNRSFYASHYSYFLCADSYIIENKSKFLNHHLSLLENYLLSIKKDIAFAAQKACESLGNHCKLSDSIPVLTRIALNGRYVAGREAAVLGFEYALESGKASKGEKAEIISILKNIARNDRSKLLCEHIEHLFETSKFLKL